MPVRVPRSPLVVGVIFHPSTPLIRVCSFPCSLSTNFPFVGITKNPEGLEKRSELRGWSVDRKRTKVGAGQDAYKKAMNAVLKWDNFNFDWFFVSNLPAVRPDAPVVVAAQTLFLWSVLPLKVTWIEKDAPSRTPDIKRRMAFGHATLEGHQLAGEEAFAVELHKNGDVWYVDYNLCAFLDSARLTRPTFVLQV
jgi:uncharacterized protein (UPF0548 family)